MKKILKKPSWDAVLNTDVCDPYNNADLTIQLKLGFKQVNPSGGLHPVHIMTTDPEAEQPEKSLNGRRLIGRTGRRTFFAPHKILAWKILVDQ